MESKVADQRTFENSDLLQHLKALDLGASVAEVDDLLYHARVETGTFWDLYKDSVDLVPGSKGSGKTALFRLFVKYLRGLMLEQNRVILAHGIESEGDQVFHVFTDRFEKLSEAEFQNFWYVYFVSLVNEVLLKGKEYRHLLDGCPAEIAAFKRECANARIPDVKAPQTLRGIMEWCLNAVYRRFIPRKIGVPTETGQMTFEFGDGDESSVGDSGAEKQPIYVEDIRRSLNALLDKAGITIWLMLDKLDEIFPRWSDVERTGLSTLLKSMYSFRSDRIRVKVFLRDDIFEHLTAGEGGFPGLSHITARMASSLTWNQQDIQHLIVKRVFAGILGEVCDIDRERMNANQEYRENCFYSAFPIQLHPGSRQSKTLNWVYNHCQDGRKVVAPRDVVELLIATRDNEIQALQSNMEGTSTSIFSAASILDGFNAMSKRKRNTFLEAEFPHFREDILKFDGGAAIYSRERLQQMFRRRTDAVAENLEKIGFLSKQDSNKGTMYKIPFLYRPAFDIRQTRA